MTCSTAAAFACVRLHGSGRLPGDRVAIELSPYDLNRGRIVYRYK